MEAELEKVSFEIKEAARCFGAGLGDEATTHLVSAATLLETLAAETPLTNEEPAKIQAVYKDAAEGDDHPLDLGAAA